MGTFFYQQEYDFVVEIPHDGIPVPNIFSPGTQHYILGQCHDDDSDSPRIPHRPSLLHLAVLLLKIRFHSPLCEPLRHQKCNVFAHTTSQNLFGVTMRVFEEAWGRRGIDFAPSRCAALQTLLLSPAGRVPFTEISELLRGTAC